jgi:hypothetical protein
MTFLGRARSPLGKKRLVLSKLTNKLFICHGFFFFLPILLYSFIFMTIKSLKKEKGINKRLYRDFPNSSFRLVI